MIYFRAHEFFNLNTKGRIRNLLANAATDIAMQDRTNAAK